ncbi:MAG: sigma-54 dependent transcriptional regulator [Nitrospiraceae bacterium]|nr:sigma-54 dependent transcriptional regulator [Nitrospiraceae bacterium]
MNGNNGNVLIVDDEPNYVKVLSAILSDEGYRIYNSPDVDRARKIIGNRDLDAVITDLMVPDGADGMRLFHYVKENYPDIPVIFLTACGTVESAVQSITCGAYYYFQKPPDYMKLKGILSQAVTQRKMKKKTTPGAGALNFGIEPGTERIIGESRQIRQILETMAAVKDVSSSVLITGETGTGKELIARGLHFSGKRKDGPFVAVNCAAIPRELMESELFGFEKGAFTNAIARRIGKFEEASGGTIFLDEVGELEMPLETKLLRVLQEREVERLGGNQRVKIDVRVVASTNRDLEKEVETGRFRRDLFYRINIVQIAVPPLRTRSGDVQLLADSFNREFCQREGKNLRLSEEAAAILASYSWPGNIRQLRNVIERAVVLAHGSEITRKDLPDSLLETGREPQFVCAEPSATGKTLRQIESEAVMNALESSGGNISEASRKLGISRKTFYKRLREQIQTLTAV